MGATDCVRTTTAKTEKEVIKFVVAKTAEMSGDSCGTYSGNWTAKEDGVNFINKTFKTFDQAWQYLVDHNDKWKCVDAVKVEEKQGTDAQNKRIELQRTKAGNARNMVHQFAKDWLSSIVGKGPTPKTCKGCKKVVPINEFYSTECPYCYHSMLNQTQEKKLAKLKEAVKKEETKLEEMILKRGGKTAKYWVVGGNCPS